TAAQDVIAAAAEQAIVTAAALQRIGAGIAIDRVVQAATSDGVAAAAGAEDGLDRVVSCLGGFGCIGWEYHRVVAAQRIVLRSRRVAARADLVEIHAVGAGAEEQRSVR